MDSVTHSVSVINLTDYFFEVTVMVVLVDELMSGIIFASYLQILRNPMLKGHIFFPQKGPF